MPDAKLILHIVGSSTLGLPFSSISHTPCLPAPTSKKVLPGLISIPSPSEEKHCLQSKICEKKQIFFFSGQPAYKYPYHHQSNITVLFKWPEASV